MAKDMSGFLKSFAGNLGQQMGGMSGMSQIGGPMSGIGIMKQMMGGGDDEEGQQNPGEKMFGMNKDKGFLSNFAGNLSDQLFQRAMMGFMRR